MDDSTVTFIQANLEAPSRALEDLARLMLDNKLPVDYLCNNTD